MAASFWTKLQRVIGAAPVLSTDQIQQAQDQLRKAGFDPGPSDGILGPKTKAACRQYQIAQGLPDSGFPDESTLKALGVQ